MSSAPLPKAARGAIFVAFLIALWSVVSVRSGPIMLLGVCFTALLSALGIWRRRIWAAYGFALLLALSILAMLFFALTGQSSGSFFQVLVSVVLYSGVAFLFALAGLSLKAAGAKRGSPIPWILIALIFAGPFVLFRPMSMPNGSMENTLLIGDFLLLDRSMHGDPAFGDIVAFRYPKDPSQIFIKRIVGLPGDRIRVMDGALYRNGDLVNEPYVTHRSGTSQNEVVVPPHEYYVLGDNRDHSFDSRNWGFLPAEEIIGKPRFIYDSLAPDPADVNAKSGETQLSQPTHPPIRRWDRVFKAL
jgi:signal peptidase I